MGRKIAVKPNQINTQQHFWDSFGNQETEISANYIVRFCQERGHWGDFSYDDINTFYQKIRNSKSDRFTFNRLTGGSCKHMTAQSFPYGEERTAKTFIEKNGDTYHITDDFIWLCYKSSPAKK